MKARPLIPRPQPEYFRGAFGMEYLLRWQGGQLHYWSAPLGHQGVGAWTFTPRTKNGATASGHDAPQKWEAISLEAAKKLIPSAFEA